jgi:hypothetical protein
MLVLTHQGSQMVDLNVFNMFLMGLLVLDMAHDHPFIEGNPTEVDIASSLSYYLTMERQVCMTASSSSFFSSQCYCSFGCSY